GTGQQTLSLPAGPYVSVTLTGISVNVYGLTVTGDVTFTRAPGTAPNTFVTTVSFANLGLTIAEGGTPYVVVSGGTGTLQTDSGASGIFGTITASVAVNVPGVGVSGTFSVQFNTTSASQQLSGSTIGQGFTFTGTGITLSLLGQSLTGNVQIIDDPTDHTVALAVTGLTLALGDGTTTFLTVTASGALILSPAGVAGSLTAQVSVTGISALSFSGAITLSVNETNKAISQTFTGLPAADTGASGSSYTLSLAAGPFIRVDVGSASSPATLTIFGQEISAHVYFEQIQNSAGDRIVVLGIDNGGLSLGTSGAGLTVGTLCTTCTSPTPLSGWLVMTAQGLAGQLQGTAYINVANVVTLQTTVTVDVNTTGTKLTQTLAASPVSGNAMTTFTEPAGPFVEVTAGNTMLTIGGVTFTANLFFEQATAAGNVKQTEIAITDLQLSSAPFFTASGVLIINPTDTSGNATTGIAGMLEGSITGTSTVGSIGATAMVAVNTTNKAINQTLTVAGQPITVKVDALASPYYQVSAQVALNLDNLVEFYGTFSLGSGAFVASNMTLFVGEGPYKQTNGVYDPAGTINPNAIGLLITNAEVSYQSETGSGQYALYATGTLAFVGLTGLNVTATVTLEINTTSSSVQVADPASKTGGTQTIGASTFVVTASGVQLDIGGVVQIGNPNDKLVVTRSASGALTVLMSDVSVGINDNGTPVFSIGGNAAFTIDPTSGFQLQSFSVTDFSVLGVSAGASGTTSALPPAADLATPLNNAVVSDATPLTTIDVSFTDPNGGSLDLTGAPGSNTVPDANSLFGTQEKFTLLLNGHAIPNLVISPVPTAVAGQPGTYAFTVTNFPTGQAGTVTIQFLPGTFATSTGVTDLGLTEQFFLVTPTGGGSLPSPGPTAALSSPAPGQSVSAASLNAAGYIDVTYTSHDGSAINESTLTGVPFTLSGTALANIKLSGGVPVLANNAAPSPLDGASSTDTSVTYRYYLQPNDPTNTSTGLFQAGTLTITFASGVSGFATVAGNTDAPNQSQTVTVTASAAGSASTSKSISLGPLSLSGPSVGVKGLTFKNGMLYVTVVLGVNSASLNLGGSGGSGATSVSLTGVQGTFKIGVDVFGLLSGHVRVSVPGNFSLSVAGLTVNVPNVVTVNASGVQIQYDPQGPKTQTLLVLQSASITLPALGVTGSILPYDATANSSVQNGSTAPTADKIIPGLTVYGDGFQLGEAQLTFTGKNGAPISLGSIVTFNSITVGVADFGYRTSLGAQPFSGSIYFATSGATFLPGKAISGSVTDSGTERLPNGQINPNALLVSFTFSNGQLSNFTAHIDTLKITLGSYLTLTASNFNLNLGAGPDQTLVSFASVGAQVTIGSLQIGGQATNFAFTGDGTFVENPGFGVYLTVGSATGSSFMWPSFLPIQITAIGLQWANIQTDPANFTLTLSASVTGIQGIKGLNFSGSVQGIQIDPALLLQGKFPVTNIQALSVQVDGPLFGGQISATLVGGVVRLDSGGNIIATTDTT
ncbi:MAG: beta strand repeat-containing protein, partial [Solirubrobacteraceae bacterium]